MNTTLPPSTRHRTGPPLSARAKRWLYLIHRWAGIVLCLFFAMWFISGVVMMYVGYPKLTPQERLAHLPALDSAAITVTPAQALAAAGAKDAAGMVLAAARGGAPVYVIPGEARRAPRMVDAASGALLPPADAATALATAQAWSGGQHAARYLGTVDEDAYTHSRALGPDRPLHRVDLDDPAHTRLYISSATGMVVLDATRAERIWNYAGAWIHWLYPFRGNALDGWWHNIVVWLSVAGVLLALTGTVVGILRWRFSRPYASGSRSPYRENMMRWHHLSGLLFAVITITWIFSGLMSMNPWKLFSTGAPPLAQAAYAGAPGDTLAAPGELIAALPAAPRELRWARADGQDVVLARSAAGAPLVLSAGNAQPHAFDPAALRAAAARLVPGARLASAETLQAYDFYYYARDEHAMLGHVEKPLPVWRLAYDDPQATWVYLDPRTGQIVSRQDSSARTSRWLFAFLHSWDWTGLLARRPLWDVLLVFLSLGGAALSLTGAVIGWRRLGKKLRA
ncbi:PepSY-associated TM helix domain-containing protein [Achromobacter aegrifaciens]|uniref:PepSY-associated TM helix domain-containing protein n=1 Tax=Achromobacter aegrifaciens TaxID=1287736 RepID=UPI0027B890D1|nr:PepSY-associated TM helix domain-containing protein [Achromobacter aegrifaciens]WLW63061.1 PepSY-associated TM helix domain-containing protein [Achromobacter aegrifaciens]